MFKRPKLSVVIIICIVIFLISLALTLSLTSIRSTKQLGKHAIEINRHATKDNALVFFLEITRRTAGAYSTYLNSVDDLVDIIAAQTKELLTGKMRYAEKKGKALSFKKYNNSDFYILKNNSDYSCFYFGEGSELPLIESQVDMLLPISPLLKAIHFENAGYFVCVWIQTANNIHFEYPKYYDYQKIDTTAMSSYFRFIFSELHEGTIYTQDKAVWTKPYKDISGKINFDIFKSVYADDGKFIASVGIDIDFTKLLSTITNNSIFSDIHDSLSDNIKSSYNIMEGFIFIVDREGSIIVCPNEYSSILSLPNMEYSKLKKYPDKLTVNLSESCSPDIRAIASEIRSSNIGAHSVTLKDDEYIIAYSVIPTTDWILCFTSREKSLMSSIEETKKTIISTENKMIKNFVIISLLFLILFIIIAALLFRFFLLKPLLIIRSKINEIGTGNFNISLNEAGFEEIADLAITFNNLTKELKEYTHNLENEIKQRQVIETELEIAGKLQNSVLPKITEKFMSSKYELYAKLIPAKEMSGDFYDFFFINSNTLCLVAADVSGKGMTAAFYMSMAKAIIKEQCLTSSSSDTGEIVTKINKILCRSVKTPMFLTMYLAFFDINNGVITYTNAGHHEYVLINREGKANFEGEVHNTFAGFFDDIIYSSTKLQLNTDEIFILYTDGITDALRKNKTIYGKENFKQIIEQNYNNKLSEIGNAIFDDVIRFQAGEKFDDITLLMLKRKG